MQTLVLWLGAIVTLGFVAAEMPDGWLGGLGRAWDAGKLSHGDFD